MYIREDTARLAADMINAVKTWAECKLDELCIARPRIKAAAPYIKRGLTNWLDRKESAINEMVDTLALFVADDAGNIDTDTIIDDAVAIFRDMDVNNTTLGAFNIQYGKGAVVVDIPRNIVFDFIFGELGQIKITAEDLLDIKTMLCA